MSARAERKFGAEKKRKLLANAHGRVLEIGIGTGLSLPHYPPGVELVGIEPSEPMLRRARRRAAELGRDVTLEAAPAEALPFEDGSFDTVVSLVVLCSVRDPKRALAEAHRVLRPGGRLLFIEHVRSDDPKLAKTQDRLNSLNKFLVGCECNRATLDAIKAEGFEVDGVEQTTLQKAPKFVRPAIIGEAVSPP
jgi:ubiquinone/menaquinone biosynthesis C-methylase UbiE